MSVVASATHFGVKPFNVKLLGLRFFSVKRFNVKECAVLLGCVLAQHGTIAQAASAPIFFQATSIAATENPSNALPVGNKEGEVASFAAFIPMADAASIRAQVASLEEAGDMYAPRIAELSEELGKVLQAEGQHGAALEAYDRSFQIIRRQEGLFSAAQAIILQAKIDSLLALGDLEGSDDMQQSLFLMQQRLLADKPVALAEAHLGFADWSLKYYLQVQQIPGFGGRTTEQDAALAGRLSAAFLQYHEALRLLMISTGNGLYKEKAAIERKIAAVTLMVDRQYQRELPASVANLGQGSSSLNKRSHNSVLSRHGSAALQRAIDYSVASADPVLIAERQLELADWYLLMDQHEEARAAYANAATSLRDAGIQEQQIAAILDPGLPVHDPETALLALAQDQTATDFDGYIDVAFELNRFGKASNARVLAGAAHDAQVEAELLRQIQADRFRPAFDQGAPVERSDVTLRYYFAR
jgi:hypothetical protein